MVGIEYKLLREEIMAPVPQRLDEGIKLTIVVIIPALRIIQLLTKILYRVSFLAKDSPYAYSRGIARNLKYPLEVR